ncbi:MAG: protein kinase domain-containing protein [Bacteroidota bacterium]
MEEGKFDRYEIRGVLGVGGMATVYRAYDPDFEREVALKILKREMLEEKDLRDRFERETKIIARLEHDAIVPVYDMGRDRDQLYYVMRLMSGGSLSERMNSHPFSPSQVLRIVERITPALDLAHQKNIVHRDLKPANILFDDHDNAFISDFGIAKSVDLPSTLTKDRILGTPTYMSPEQAQGDEVDGRSDVYSLAIIVFQLLSGRAPFEDTTPMKIVVKRITEPPPHIRAFNPEIPVSVENVLLKAMAKDRQERYGTCASFVEALKQAFSAPSAPPVEPARSGTSRPGFWLITGIIVLLLVLIGAWGTLRNMLSPVPSPTFTATAVTSVPPETSIPSTAPPLPTETPPPPTVVIDPGIGGANRIAFTANREIYVSNIDGTGIESLTNTGVPKHDLQWLPGGDALLYIESSCVYRIQADAKQQEPEKLLCFKDPKFTGFRVSPDGTKVAISIAGRLVVLPFDPAVLATAATSFELQKLEGVCVNYTDVNVKDALWSADGERLAIRYQGMVNGHIGETVRVISPNWERCLQAEVFTWDDFPGRHFVPDRYARNPKMPSYAWDGVKAFLMNVVTRNGSYGDLYSFDLISKDHPKINPIDGACCYGTAVYSPDGTHILLVFQDENKASENETQLYYIPIDQIGTRTPFTPLPLPASVFSDARENIQLALRPSQPVK